MSEPDLNGLRVFARVADLGSFSAAARSLQSPVSTISRKVAELEERLGVLLIKRTTRKLSLSEEGRRLFDSSAGHLQALAEAEAKLTCAGTSAKGALRVSAPVAFGRGEFIDFVSLFARTHPEIRLDLSITNEFVDLVRSGVDVAIRFGELEDASVIVRRLGVSRRVLVASPAYLKQRRKPRTVPELTQHDCVLFAKTESAEWLLQRGKRRAKVSVRGALSANNFETVTEFAVRGHGIALVPAPYSLTGLANGSLVRVLPEWSSAAIPVHAVYLARKFVPRRLQTFLSALTSWENFTWRKEPASASSR